MKFFLKKLTGYTLFLSLLFFLLLLMLSFFNKRLLTHYKNDSRYNTLIMGDSHVQNAVDDRQMPYTINLSQGLENFIFSYAKLKIMLESHPYIKRVLLGCSYHNLSGRYEEYIMEKGEPSLLKKNFFLLSLKEQYWLLWHNRTITIPLLRGAIKTGFYNIASPANDYSFIGYHININVPRAVNTESIRESVKKDYYAGKDLKDFFSVNIYYLNKIIDLCRSKNIELFILNPPTHSTYKALVPTQYKEKLRSLTDGRARLLEFNDLQLADSCFLPDGRHLSGKGAAIVTANLKAMLEKE